MSSAETERRSVFEFFNVFEEVDDAVCEGAGGFPELLALEERRGDIVHD